MAFISSLFTVRDRQDVFGYNSPRCPTTNFQSKKLMGSPASLKLRGNALMNQEFASKKVVTEAMMESVTTDQAGLGTSEPSTNSMNAETVSNTSTMDALDDSMAPQGRPVLNVGVSPSVFSAGEYIADRFTGQFVATSCPDGVYSVSYMADTVRSAEEDPKYEETRVRYRMGQRSTLLKLAEFFENRKRAIQASQSSYEESLVTRFQEVASVMLTGVM